MSRMMSESKHSSRVQEDELDLKYFFLVLKPCKWRIVIISLCSGIITLVLMFLMPNAYRASAVITPAAEEGPSISSLGALSATFGFSLGAPTKLEDLEALIRSNDLTVRVFNKNKLWSFIVPDRFDSDTGKLKVGWKAQLLGGKMELETPGEWDAIRIAENCLSVSVNKKMGTLTIAFESPSPGGSAEIVAHYLEEAKSRLQEEAFDRAAKNKMFIKEQIGKTVDALTRERLYSLYGQEVEREMMARNREQFGFRIIDRPRIPDRKSGPHRALAVVLATMLSVVALSIYYGNKGKKNAMQ